MKSAQTLQCGINCNTIHVQYEINSNNTTRVKSAQTLQYAISAQTVVTTV